MERFVHLGAATSYSLRGGVIRPRELVEQTAARGMVAVGITDRDGLYGAVRVAQAAAAAGVRPIFGADLALAPHPTRPGWQASRGGRERAPGQSRPGAGAAWLEDDAPRISLLARTQTGYANLCRIVSDAHLESVRSSPHVTWEQLGRRAGGGRSAPPGGGGRPAGGGRTTPPGSGGQQAGRRDSTDAGLFVLLGDDSPVARLLDAGRPDAAAVEARHWMGMLGPGSVLVGVTHHLAPGDDARARARFGLADRLGVRAVAHQAPRYLDPADARLADVMDAVRQQTPLDPRHARRRNAEGYLKSPAQMARVFTERPDALANTTWVAERCAVDLGLGQLRLPDFVASRGKQATAELRARCEAGIAERYDALTHRHRDLLERELAMVARLDLAPYFLTVAEIVERIRAKQIMVACRGSAAGSLICYALRISDVDPVAHDLVFERFMNPYRDTLPDIDLDVESARREDIYRDLLATYGEDRVACVCMVETFKARMAIREVGKALGLPAGEIGEIAKAFPHVRAGEVRAALAHMPELRGLNLDHPQFRLLFDVVERLDGLPRHLALHPSGVLLADATLRDLVPVERSAAGFVMAQFDKDDVEALGLCKLDVLAVRMLSSIAHCRDELRRTRGVELDLDAIAWDDEATYELIRSTRTLGMFQIESPGQRELIGKFQPEHLGDLVVDISLFRPGPVKGDMVKPFLLRRLGKVPTVAHHPLLERALGETYGVIVYHEQVMRCVAAMTGCDLATADLVRRQLADPTEADRLRAWFLAGARQRGLADDDAVRLWAALVQFASFGFCKAHAAAFSVPTYRSAWLKRHYAPEFIAGLLTHDPGMYPRRLLLDDARQFGIAVLPLDVNVSARDYRVERLPARDAYGLLGVWEGATGARPRGWRCEQGRLLPPAGFDLGADPDDPAWRFGLRLGLQDVAGIDETMIDSLLAGRPFTSVADLRRRSALSAPVAEALAHAGALDDLGGVAVGDAGGGRGSGGVAVGDAGGGRGSGGVARRLRGPSRRDVLLEACERWSGLARHRPAQPDAPEQLGLLASEETPGLAEYRASERVRAELEVLGLDASTHVVSFYDGLLDTLGVTRVVDLASSRDGQRVRVAGVKVATQTPPVRSGQRIIFLSLDDATGVSDATFFESVHERCAWTVFHSWLLVVQGTVRRTGRRGISVNAEAAWDLRRLMRAWREGWLDEAVRDGMAKPAERREPADPPRRLWHASGGSAG